MNGNSLFLDTNIIIYFLSGDQTLAELIDEKTLYVSSITYLELLSYPDLTSSEEEGVRHFLSECIIVDMNSVIMETVISVRKAYRLKLPDSIIIASALYLDLPIVTSDKAFNKVEELGAVYYEKQ
ncbi:MAG: type II toxin-antitoxin system VapC family toxin [Cyclobacteriaceae bacterium]|nr:type II toxin-antitoxin system VapC family toxin [Cyclobacteriaceae bacterium]